jgi:hypothetical protein
METVTVPTLLGPYRIPTYVSHCFVWTSACALHTRPAASSPVELPTQHFIAHFFLSLTTYTTVLSSLSFFLCIGQQLFGGNIHFSTYFHFHVLFTLLSIPFIKLTEQTHRDWVFNN